MGHLDLDKTRFEPGEGNVLAEKHSFFAHSRHCGCGRHLFAPAAAPFAGDGIHHRVDRHRLAAGHAGGFDGDPGHHLDRRADRRRNLGRTRARERVRPWLRRMRGAAISILACVLVLAALVLASQWMAHTPPILDEMGKPLPNSIASLEKVRLGGVDQWLIVRGQDVNKPVLLFLSGGPGGSEAGRVLRFNQELEKHFVVVIWEQRGCAKSYPSLRPKSALTVDQYASDIIELTGMLRERFDEEKIYLVGHSWGTIIGVRAVQQRPDLFYAYVGTSQMVNVRETDQIIYDVLMEHARQTGDAAVPANAGNAGRAALRGQEPRRSLCPALYPRVPGVRDGVDQERGISAGG